MFKKTMLAAVMAFALVAVSAQAAQASSAEWWIHTSGGEETLQGQEELHAVGSLTSTALGAEFGPCELTFEGVAENVNGMAGGVISGGHSLAGCGTSLPGCTIKEVKFANFNWSVTATENDEVDISEPTFTNVYEPFCANYGLTETSAVGNITGELTTTRNSNGEDCINFEESGGLAIETPPFVGAPVAVDGEICITHPLTLK